MENGGNMKTYKIKNTKTGEYSTGGSPPKFGKIGKSWASRGNLNKHLAYVADTRREMLYQDCIIEEYGIVNTESLDGFEIPIRERQAEVEHKRQERYQKRKEEREKAELAKLKAKYEK